MEERANTLYVSSNGRSNGQGSKREMGDYATFSTPNVQVVNVEPPLPQMLEEVPPFLVNEIERSLQTHENKVPRKDNITTEMLGCRSEELGKILVL